ncbi:MULTISPECIES: hypothetical protein [Lactiplantibacillus]|uniref:Uncharacterized protein n=1 Tax=Lactiplantibacillus argentoratensis TaxID=271881 RepID=A0ABS5UGK9_9LACO|nr:MULTISPECIES: hypothetical protein [Lactiplantibacillus]MBT1137711.1 hypothetical protein [Lactiplantibacillus argentoratensis]
MNNYHWTPAQWLSFSVREKALIVAGIDIRLAEEKRQEKDAKRKARKH